MNISRTIRQVALAAFSGPFRSHRFEEAGADVVDKRDYQRMFGNPLN